MFGHLSREVISVGLGLLKCSAKSKENEIPVAKNTVNIHAVAKKTSIVKLYPLTRGGIMFGIGLPQVFGKYVQKER